MTKNKLIWSFALVLLLSIPAVFAQAGIFGNEWVILIVNSLIVWIVLFVAQTFVVPEKAAKEKIVIWIITLVLAVIIAWNVTDTPGSHYIWQAGFIAQFFSIKILVNTILIAGAAYFGAGLLGVEPKTKQGQIGIGLLAILIAGMIALNIGPDEWLWDNSNIKGLKDYLFAPEHTETDPATGKQTRVGGILRPEGPPKGQYRLLVFGASALVFAWFLIAFLNITTGNNRLSYAMAIIIAASLAHRGENLDIVRKIAEVLSYLIVLKQIPPDIFAAGGALPGIGAIAGPIMDSFGKLLRYLVAGLLVGWIFCTAFGTSTIGEVINKIPGIKEIGIDPCPAKACGPGSSCPAGKVCTGGKCVSSAPPAGTGGSGTGASGPPTGKSILRSFICKFTTNYIDCR